MTRSNYFTNTFSTSHLVFGLSAFGLDLSEDPRPKAKDLNIIKNENLLLNCARNSARCRLRSATFRRGEGEAETSAQTNTQFKVEKVAGGLEVPWSIVWAPDGRMIVTERTGRAGSRNGTLNPKPLFVVSDVEKSGESGLMGVALHPQFSSNRWIYLSYAYSSDDVRVRVVR